MHFGSFGRLTLLSLLFLVSAEADAAGLNVEHYDHFEIVDGVIDFSTANLVHTGTDANVDLWTVSCSYAWNPIPGDDHYGVRWYGYLRIDVPGSYGFGTVSDDGSQVWIDGKLILDNKELQWWDWEDCVSEGSHTGLYPEGYGDPDSLTGLIHLAVGYHPIEIRFFEDAVYDGIEFWWLKPGSGPSDIPYYGISCAVDTMVENAATNWEIVPMSALETTLPLASPAASVVTLMHHEAFPNPFNPATQISFSLAREARVGLQIYDMRGRRVRRLADREKLAAGPHQRTWNGQGDRGEELAGGVYLYRLSTGSDVASGRLVLLK